jgi:hypothetical protein
MSEMPTRLLRDALRARTTTSPPQECLDAETAAAWVDEALAPQERAAVEAHAADCASCQALLAALARTAPPPTRSWWRMPALGWLVPLTAAAAALVIWINVPFRARSAPPGRGMTVRTEPLTSAPLTQAPAGAPLESARDARAKPPVERRAAAKPVDKIAPEKVAPTFDAPQGESPRVPARLEAVQDPARESTAPAAGRGKVAANALSAAESAAKTAPTPTTPPSPSPTAPAAQSATATTTTAASSAATLRFGDRAAGRLMLESTALQTPIVSTSSPNSRWRILAGGGVQHSTDGGATWHSEPTGITVTLTAGASPSPTVCWLVGPGGIVLLSNGNRPWQRLTFPEAIDLISIAAADDKRATVTTSDGRAFATTDGGAAWTLVPLP